MTRWKPNLKYDHAFAIVRIDGFHHDTDLMEKPEVLVIVKKVVWSREVAESEVERLNRLKAGSEVKYFWTIARVEKRTAQHSYGAD
jgi:hypothetical protein